MLFIIALIAAIGGWFSYTYYKKRVYKREASISLAVVALSGVIAFGQCWTMIPAGHVGVIDFFGNVSDNTLYPGVNFVNPLANVVKFDARTQELKETMTVPSKEGLSIELELSLLFSLNFENANKTIEATFAQAIDKLDADIHELDYKIDWLGWTEEFARKCKQSYFNSFPEMTSIGSPFLLVYPGLTVN